MKAVILAGGLGTRLREETEFKPKPMVEIGDKPILWHLMKSISFYDIRDFVVCLGYKGEQIREYFLNYHASLNDVTVSTNLGISTISNETVDIEDWDVTLANTGKDTHTGGRIYRARKYINNETFLCTYGDGLGDIDIAELEKFHKKHGKIATVTAVHPPSRFGGLNISDSGKVDQFREKPKESSWVSGGFFIFEPEIFDFLGQDSVLEKKPLETLSDSGELFAYKHEGFWQPMDTIRETEELNRLWNTDSAPWKNW
jgi:glucose-1-phosphate cytidylyltransferase